MKKNWQSILNVVMAILLIICLVEISSLTDRVNKLNTNFTSQMNIMRESVNNISRDVSNSLEKQASLLSDATWEYGEIDIEKKTAQLKVVITPKEYDATDTKAYISAGTSAYPLTLEGGSFTGILELPLFQETYLDKVRFVEGSDTQTEKLDWYFTPANDMLPQIYADFSYTYNSGETQDGKCMISLSGDLNINMENVQDMQIKAINLAASDGKNVIWHKDITSEVTDDNNSNGIIPDSASTDSRHFYYTVDEELTLASGNDYTVYCEVTDADGLCYRNILLKLTATDKAVNINSENDYDYIGMPAAIYDTKGNLLYKAQ